LISCKKNQHTKPIIEGKITSNSYGSTKTRKEYPYLCINGILRTSLKGSTEKRNIHAQQLPKLSKQNALASSRRDTAQEKKKGEGAEKLTSPTKDFLETRLSLNHNNLLQLKDQKKRPPPSKKRSKLEWRGKKKITSGGWKKVPNLTFGGKFGEMGKNSKGSPGSG